MDITSALTVSNLTPPGYFNLSEDADAGHKAYITWWNNILAKRSTDAVNLKKLILTPWMVDHLDSPRTPWMQYLTTQYGIGFFNGTNNQAAALYRLLSSAWDVSTIYNVSMVIQTLCLPPFSWFSGGGISAGNLVSSIMDTGFIIYSTLPSPTTPVPSAYAPRAWTAPVGWTRAASSAASYCRGYISSATIIWSYPRPITDFENAYVFSADVPIAVATSGTVAIVDDDSSGDRASVYYSDGTSWLKNSCPNTDLGLVNPVGVRPSPEAITVWSPDPASVPYAIASNVPPPSTGRSEGMGTFASWSETNVFNDAINIIIHQISGGTVAIATIIEVFRRVKPTGKIFILNIDGTIYNISDKRQKT